LFEPATINEASVKAMHLEIRGNMNKMTTQKELQQQREEGQSPLVHIVRKRDTTKRIVGKCTLR